MCCFFTTLLFFGPRLAFLIYWLVWPVRVYAVLDTWIWPLLGLIFLPWTFLMYVIVASPGPGLGAPRILSLIEHDYLPAPLHAEYWTAGRHRAHPECLQNSCPPWWKASPLPETAICTQPPPRPRGVDRIPLHGGWDNSPQM